MEHTLGIVDYGNLSKVLPLNQGRNPEFSYATNPGFSYHMVYF